MKRLALLLIAAVLLLGGCSDPVGMPLACKDIQLTIPADFIDLSGEDYAKNSDFYFGRKTLIFHGLSEYKAIFLEEMSLEEYTAHVIEANELTCSAEANGSGYLFSYEAPIGDTTYTYITATYEGADYFWILQFYCPTANLAENQAEIQIILESLQPAA